MNCRLAFSSLSLLTVSAFCITVLSQIQILCLNCSPIFMPYSLPLHIFIRRNRRSYGERRMWRREKTCLDDGARGVGKRVKATYVTVPPVVDEIMNILSNDLFAPTCPARQPVTTYRKRLRRWHCARRRERAAPLNILPFLLLFLRAHWHAAIFSARSRRPHVLHL